MWENNPGDVPKPKPRGGFRKSKMTRDLIEAVAQKALDNPKVTLKDLQEELKDGINDLNPVNVHPATIANALHKTGLRHKTLRHIDPKVFQAQNLMRERANFKRHQKTDETFKADRLLFFDESAFYLNEQAHKGWGATNNHRTPILMKVKGKTKTTSLFLTLGIHWSEKHKRHVAFVHYKMYPPVKEFEDLVAPSITDPEAAEHYDDGVFRYKLALTRTFSVGKDNITADYLQQILKAFCIKTSVNEQERDNNVKQPKDVYWERFEHLINRGPVGLPRRGFSARNAGGRRRPFRGTARDVAWYFEQLCLPEYRLQYEKQNPVDKRQLTKHFKNVRIVWDNAPTHSAVLIDTVDTISMFHSYARDTWKIGGVIFTPPRSPAFNPVESAFAYVKQYVRKRAPEKGYDQSDLEKTITEACEDIRKHPKMVGNWILKSCRYRLNMVEERDLLDEPQDKKQDSNPIKPIYANANGTVHEVEQDGDKNIAAAQRVPNFVPLEDPNDQQPLRYAGYGDGPPVDVEETKAESIANSMVDGRRMYEPEAITSERVKDGQREYLIKWKGYRRQTWEPEENLTDGHGYQALFYQWKHDLRNGKKCEPDKDFLKNLLQKRKYLKVTSFRKAHNVTIYRFQVQIGNVVVSKEEGRTEENAAMIDEFERKRKR